MKKRIKLLILVMVMMLSFTGRTYASEGVAKSEVNEGGSIFDWFVRRPSEIEPFYKQYGDYIYAGGKLELKQYTLPGKLRIEKSLEFPQPDTNSLYGNRLIINAREIVITGDVTASNYVQLHALPIADKGSDKNKGSGNFIIKGKGNLTTQKLKSRAIREGMAEDITVVSATGDFYINDNARLNIQEDGEGTVIEINGDFIANSNSVTDLSYGEIKVGENVDLQKKFISKGESAITLTGSRNRTIKGVSDSKIKTLKLSFDALKGLKIKKKWLQKGYFQCTEIVFDYHSHTIPTNIIDKYFYFEELSSTTSKDGKKKQIIDYAKSFFYTIFYTNKVGKVDINKTFLHVEGKKNDDSTVYAVNIQEFPTTITLNTNSKYEAKISLVYTGIGKPLKPGSVGFATLTIKLNDGSKYEYAIATKSKAFSEEAFMTSMKEGASLAISDLAKDVLMDQVVSDLLDVSKEFEWKKGIVIGYIGKSKDLLDKLGKRLDEWRNMVKGFPDFENSETDMIPAVENHTQAGLEVSEDSNESGANESNTTGLSGDAARAMYEQTIADYDKMMYEGQLSYREKNRDTYEDADRYTYYTIVDIDGNGVEELILRFDRQDASHLTNQNSGYGESTYIYTIHDGIVKEVLLPEYEPESPIRGFVPNNWHIGFTHIFKGSNLISRGTHSMLQYDDFYSYKDGALSESPVLEITRGDDTWLINNEKKTPEECIEAYNTAANNDEGYELQLYERKTDNQNSGTADIIEKYKSFIKSHNEGNYYLIYDVDKDGYPELMINRSIPEDRCSVYDVYTYKNEEFKFLLTPINGYNHGPAAFASYPDGNGIVEHVGWKGKESVSIETWEEGTYNSQIVYNEDADTSTWRYYIDEYDEVYSNSENGHPYYNHQYYQGENYSPYFEGSYLLAHSAMDNFTAVYEAFGAEEEIITSSENNDNTFMGISPLDPGVEINTASNGNTYRIRYESTEKSDEYVGLNLYVNDIAESYRLDAVYYPSIENVYVTDIDISDSYRNIVVVIYGEDDDSSTYLFAFNENEIHLISEFQGRLVPESVCGDGKVLLVFWIGMSIQNYGSFTVRPEIIVHDLTAKQEALHSGRTTYSDEKANYEEGFEVIIKKEISVYSDASMTEAKGIIPAGSSVKCEYTNEYINEPYGRVFYVSDGNTEGYVTSRFFRDCCDDVKFAG